METAQFIFKSYLTPFGGPELLLLCNFYEKEIALSLPPFYQHVTQSWKHFYSFYENPENNKEIRILKSIFDKCLKMVFGTSRICIIRMGL
jgi:hypothetical protein